jgi:hypothetical protein
MESKLFQQRLQKINKQYKAERQEEIILKVKASEKNSAKKKSKSRFLWHLWESASSYVGIRRWRHGAHTTAGTGAMSDPRSYSSFHSTASSENDGTSESCC